MSDTSTGTGKVVVNATQTARCDPKPASVSRATIAGCCFRIGTLRYLLPDRPTPIRHTYTAFARGFRAGRVIELSAAFEREGGTGPGGNQSNRSGVSEAC
jgi:hypothetical protein